MAYKGTSNLMDVTFFEVRVFRYAWRLVPLFIIAEAHVGLLISVVVSDNIVTSALAIRDG